ncbi:Tad domain-containing protein [Bdellovibrio bacteriovorus]|uniref:Tad domain-containing protein n=1 Tax=Bdellovibrio bacteriovorus TaxID=959 RepID=UPI0035A6148C
MLNSRSTFIQNLNNKRGQIALFVALIFQILFLFFAMVINVGLLVHHKINLQNSVDLAAYYGAMKQAEGMNVIAHTNYQIRQSWKLLAWRYRMLGTAGDFEEHPFDKVGGGRIRTTDDDSINPGAQNFYDSPSFCITYIPFKPMPDGENTCKALSSHTGINVFKIPPVLIDLPSVSGRTRSLALNLRASLIERCKDFGSFNYLMLGGFVVAFNIDQGNRALLISYLSKAMSPSSPDADFFDIDGKSVKLGMENTLKNNLTAANNTSDLKMSIYNSLGHSACNGAQGAKGEPARWLKQIKTYPGFSYIDTICTETSITPKPKMLSNVESDLPNATVADGRFRTEVDELKNYIGIREPISDIYNYSIGVEKNPWCMAYVGVSASARPKIPFSPFGSLEIKARAFYKPFGGRIGPWYYNKYPSGSASYNGSQGSPNDKTDPNLPPRLMDQAHVGVPGDPTRIANYSRYVGDKVGLKSRRVLYHYGRAIYKLDPNWVIGSDGNVEPGSAPVNYGDTAPNFEHWKHLPFNFYQRGGNQDLLAWDHANDQPSRMRMLELSAILPDPFDLTYYSIEPDFYHNYYTRLRDGFLKTIGSAYYTENKEFLGDIGTHKGSNKEGINWDKFSVIDQYKAVSGNTFMKTFVDIAGKLTYISTKWQDVLTSWAPVSLVDYSLDPAKFGKCTITPRGADSGEPEVPNPGNCVSGGTTGYSVKMVSSDYLRRTDLELGGTGVRGALLNPPPEDSEF